MSKPLGEWTLAELGKFCREQTEPCPKCPFLYICEMSPDVWDFTPKPRYTEDEVALAKLLMKAGIKTIEIYNVGYPLITMRTETQTLWLPKETFPSLEVKLL